MFSARSEHSNPSNGPSKNRKNDKNHQKIDFGPDFEHIPLENESNLILRLMVRVTGRVWKIHKSKENIVRVPQIALKMKETDARERKWG